MTDWKIEKSKLTCAASGREIAPGEVFWSRLVEGHDAEGMVALLREDYSSEAWPPETESFCFWKSERKVEEDHGPRMLDTDTLFEIFRETNPETEEPRKVNFRYLLALILMRKKMLKEVPGSTLDMLCLSDSTDAYEVIIPTMDLEARRLAEEDIGQLIVGLPEPVEGDEGTPGPDGDGEPVAEAEPESAEAQPAEEPADDTSDESVEPTDKAA